MLKTVVITLAGLLAFAPLLAGVAGCEDDSTASGGSLLDDEKISSKHPDSERPAVIFPIEHQTENVLLNEFIRKTLEICADGDYDRFRQLFGISYRPPGAPEFERVWLGVKEIAVTGIYAGRREPPEYFVNATVRLRKPDRQGKAEREVWVWVFREAEEWRIGPTPRDVVRRYKVASTQPGALRGGASSRPASAPAGGPADGSPAAPR